LIRSEVPHLDSDRVLYPDIASVKRMVQDGRIAHAVREARVA